MCTQLISLCMSLHSCACRPWQLTLLPRLQSLRKAAFQYWSAAFHLQILTSRGTALKHLPSCCRFQMIPHFVAPYVCMTNSNKKLIRRWGSERELSLRRRRAASTKYNRLVHKFCHRSTRLCVGTHVFTKFSEITQYNGDYVVQGYSRSPILVSIKSSCTTSY